MKKIYVMKILKIIKYDNKNKLRWITTQSLQTNIITDGNMKQNEKTKTIFNINKMEENESCKRLYICSKRNI